MSNAVRVAHPERPSVPLPIMGALLLVLMVAAWFIPGQVLRSEVGHSPVPYGSEPTLPAAAIADHIIPYIDNWMPERDPLVMVEGGAQAKASNVYGIAFEGTRYYYQLTRQTSFDPLRRSHSSPPDYTVVIVLNEGTPWEVLIYRLR